MLSSFQMASRTGSDTGMKVFLQKAARRLVLGMPRFMRDGLWPLFDSNAGVERCLRNLKRKGFQPANIIDSGAYLGLWTRMIKQIFPDSKVLMIEPQPSRRAALLQAKNDFSGTVDFVQCLVGPETKDLVPFYEIEGGGSSVLGELTPAPRKTVTLPMRKLDDILAEEKISGPLLLKLDVQGYELEALKGADQTMRMAEVILMEVSFVRYNPAAPLFHDVVDFMQKKGFLVYDIFPLARWKEITLFQGDVFFVKENSSFRQIDFAAED
jgi:FkbM family methyltransferase